MTAPPPPAAATCVAKLRSAMVCGKPRNDVIHRTDRPHSVECHDYLAPAAATCVHQISRLWMCDQPRESSVHHVESDNDEIRFAAHPFAPALPDPPADRPAWQRDGYGHAQRSVADPPADPPQSQCPRCHAWQSDLDGFGVLKCDRCDYCSHASIDGHVCTLCNQQIGEDGKATDPPADRAANCPNADGNPPEREHAVGGCSLCAVEPDPELLAALRRSVGLPADHAADVDVCPCGHSNEQHGSGEERVCLVPDCPCEEFGDDPAAAREDGECVFCQVTPKCGSYCGCRCHRVTQRYDRRKADTFRHDIEAILDEHAQCDADSRCCVMVEIRKRLTIDGGTR
jgi:hypothetical protein